jgi:hypothetical protein
MEPNGISFGGDMSLISSGDSVEAMRGIPLVEGEKNISIRV